MLIYVLSLIVIIAYVFVCYEEKKYMPVSKLDLLMDKFIHILLDKDMPKYRDID